MASLRSAQKETPAKKATDKLLAAWEKKKAPEIKRYKNLRGKRRKTTSPPSTLSAETLENFRKKLNFTGKLWESRGPKKTRGGSQKYLMD